MAMTSVNNAVNVGGQTEEKRQALYALLQSVERLMVAYSGGTDSAYLAYAAHQVLGSRMLAVIADSPSLARTDLRAAVEFAESHGIPLRVVETHELEDATYVRNDGNRCFRCKDELFQVMAQVGEPLGFSAVAYGMNVDDRGDFRPGQKAAAQHHVLAPLADAGLTKQEIRTLAHEQGLAIWNKPASACLSSRVAYGLPVTRETLDRIEKGEAILFAMGFQHFRLRHHGELARIEIARNEMERMLSLSTFAEVSAAMKRIGYTFVTLDLDGYRSGSMNALLSISQIATAGEPHKPDAVVQEAHK
jgi:pyridinium-3,5-biscarboxylic acid mononucleotide sulfurtransferase